MTTTGHEDDDDQTGEYRYRYKYLYKYGEHGDDKPDQADAEKSKDQQPDDSKSGKKDDGKQEKKGTSKRKRTIVLVIIALVFIIAAVTWLLLYIFIFSQRATTDDAYVKGNMVTISPRVAGTVVEIAVDETERVHAGQVLMRLDPADAEVTLMNARGQLAQAVRNAQQSMQQANEADAAVMQRQAEYQNDVDQYRRRFPLVAEQAVAREEADSAQRQMRGALAALKQAQASAAAAHAQVDGTDIHNFPAVVQARANFRNAWINNNRNAIVSPIDGYAARRQVQVGQRVQPGQNLLTIVPLHDLWVDANFKETQLENIRIGQPVTLTTDIYSHVTYHGKVIGVDGGTGSAFSLLPAENATGNWIKVVQRVPVRISLDSNELDKHTLWLGLSTYVTVDTSNLNGSMLDSKVRSKPLMSTNVYEAEVKDADQQAEKVIQDNMVSQADTSRADNGSH